MSAAYGDRSDAHPAHLVQHCNRDVACSMSCAVFARTRCDLSPAAHGRSLFTDSCACTMPAAAEQALLSRTDFQVVSMGSTFGRTAAMMSLKVATLPSSCTTQHHFCHGIALANPTFV